MQAGHEAAAEPGSGGKQQGMAERSRRLLKEM